MTISRSLDSVLLAREPAKAEAYCWDPSWVRQGESWWSIIHKWRHANAASSRQIAALIGTPSSTRSHYTSKVTRIALVDEKDVDNQRAGELFQLPEATIYAASVSYYVIKDEERLICSDALRYCPVCIKFGYHCAAFQTPFIGSCPLHSIRLIENCARCGNRASPYKLTTGTMQCAYACQSCGHPLWAGNSPYDTDPALANKNPDAFFTHPAIRWLTKRQKHRVIAHNLDSWIGKEADVCEISASSDLKVHAMIKLWDRITDSCFPSIRATSWRRNWDFVMGRKSFIHQPRENLDTADLIPIYKRIRAFLSRTQLGMTLAGAGAEFSEYLDAIKSKDKGERKALHRRKFYVLVRAFSTWRMHWERKSDPGKLFSRRKKFGGAISKRLPLGKNVKKLRETHPTLAKAVLLINCVARFCAAVNAANNDTTEGVRHKIRATPYSTETETPCYWVAIRERATREVTIFWVAPVHSDFLRSPFVAERARFRRPTISSRTH